MITLKKKKSRAQAAIFDGIMFLLLTSFSVAIIFSFLNTYGEAQDRVLRSSNVINYMHSIMKEIYYVDANTLSKASEPTIKGDYLNESVVYAGLNCSNLSQWGISVGDVVKKDMLDGNLDDKFGDKGGIALGKLSLRCLFKEIMKPFRQAGYHYFAEILETNNYKPIHVFGGSLAPSGGAPVGSPYYPFPWITDVVQNPAAPEVYSCVSPAINTTSLLAVSTPFRILNGTANTDYLIRVCVWRAV